MSAKLAFRCTTWYHSQYGWPKWAEGILGDRRKSVARIIEVTVLVCLVKIDGSRGNISFCKERGFNQEAD